MLLNWFLIISRGQTALHKAATARQRAVCCMLVAAGSSLTLADRDGSTARQLAEKAGDTDLAIYLESQLFLCTFYKFHKQFAYLARHLLPEMATRETLGSFRHLFTFQVRRLSIKRVRKT